MKLVNHTITLLLLVISANLTSQNGDISCGTEESPEFIYKLQSIKPELKKIEQEVLTRSFSKKTESKQNIQKVPVQFHILRNSDDSVNIDAYAINQALENLNDIFIETQLKFYLYQNINYITDSDYIQWNKGDEVHVVKTDYTSGIINIYFTDNIKNSSGNNICGYSINKNNSHLIIMKKDCLNNGSSLAHEMGHVFSLLHTHGPSNSNTSSELVNGSNCDTEGDGICDTPADPCLSSNNVDNFCSYTGAEKDPNGDSYYPDTENIMSYSRKGCRNQFTPQQLARMYAYFNVEKKAFIQSESIIQVNEDSSDNYDLNKVSIYPNPISENKIYLNNQSTLARVNYQITNLHGQILMSGEVINSIIDASSLSSGTYFLELAGPDYRVVKKFIK
ncbi:zinc-dependent metalloprotease [Cognatitamlana onchidii]|uniref:zinc-dependent metalloprotease n=1 Tax=Cognatitamlana onchidii TaxID=2562860 RepID=UPI0010A62BFB|nr:zinc-dependent metalloprotease [Algibacter onchidii]